MKRELKILVKTQLILCTQCNRTPEQQEELNQIIACFDPIPIEPAYPVVKPYDHLSKNCLGPERMWKNARKTRHHDCVGAAVVKVDRPVM